MNNKDVMCPSAPFKNDSFLLGGVNAQGEVDYLGGPVQLTEQMATFLNNLESPEKHFRFTATCRNKLCGQWSNGKCSLGKAIASSDFQTDELDSQNQNCGIRTSCRWLRQEGPEVCKLCNLIVTDVSR